IVEAARRSGYPARATSTPGVAQRTGATTYYFELFPEFDPPQAPIFSLYPSAGDVDLMAALEPTEAAKALEKGYVTKGTTVVTATERTFSTAEKVAAGDGTIPTEPLLAALGEASANLIALPMSAITKGKASQSNAVLLGAIAGTDLLPIPADDYRQAIREKGIAVDLNLAGFDIGLDVKTQTKTDPSPTSDKKFDQPPPGFQADIDEYPTDLRPLIGHGLARLVDYQDGAYAKLFLTRLRGIAAKDQEQSKTLTREVAARLAAWMSFEDVIRVAQLKTRPGRLANIRKDLNLAANAPLQVHDYFSPGHAEISGFLPPVLAWLVPKGNRGAAGKGWSLRWPTGSAPGFAALKLLASLRWMRRSGSQYARENAAIRAWLAAIEAAAAYDYDLAVQTARLAIWARGYGYVRHEGLGKLAELVDGFEERLPQAIDQLKRDVDTSLLLAHADPDSATPH
ncbi:MAG: indolepyruvate oxidoreductase subunit beta family protein, partial [Alphaproteobacteria bacterium]|nr:indolepyruvate oxidoreductase subunit beta family protein [Alphaproteobacteria bacterium]